LYVYRDVRVLGLEPSCDLVDGAQHWPHWTAFCVDDGLLLRALAVVSLNKQDFLRKYQ
jgi:hypothetical protein